MDINHPSTKRFVDLLRSFDLELLVKTPTHVTHSTQSTINNIISNLQSVAVSVVNTAISDHYGQEAIISGVKVANRLNTFFRSVACEQGPCPSLPQGISRRRQCPVVSLVLAPVVEEELENIIQQLPAKKSND
ncbi:hypothetical protein J6590_062941 [Homalodisca vitripennis]|nr:hypothetical protein J6590_062941 [Homalodisca vitripennis]